MVVLKALSTQMFQLLAERVGTLANRRVFYLPFSRNVHMSSSKLDTLRALYSQCIEQGGILVAQPEHILSFKLMSIDRLTEATAPEDVALAQGIADLQNWLTFRTRDILDESDEILHVRYQLIYTSGMQKPLEDHPDRWETAQHLFSLAGKHAAALKGHYPEELEYSDYGAGRFSPLRILPVGEPIAGNHLTMLLARDVMKGEVPNLNLLSLRPTVRNAIFKLLIQRDVNRSDYDWVKEESGGMWKGILLIRGFLAYGILVYVLRSKRYRVNYGLDPRRSLLAVPYTAKVRSKLSADAINNIIWFRTSQVYERSSGIQTFP